MSKLLDWLFGRRFHKGWPRGVKPICPQIEAMKEFDPPLWEQTKAITPASAGFRIWAKRYPAFMAELFPYWFPEK